MVRSALNVAEATFAAASVDVVWKVCGPAECNVPPTPTERLVRLRAHPRVEGVTRVASAIPDRRAERHRCAGHGLHRSRSQPYPSSRYQPHHAVRSNDRSRIGHLLLATNTHSTSGLMRELWSPDELLASRADDWVLRPFEAAAIRQRLTMSRADDPNSAL